MEASPSSTTTSLPISAALGFKAAGVLIHGDSCEARQWASETLADLLKRRLANVDLVLQLSDSLRTRNIGQLKYDLLRINATGIPTHWMRIMDPSTTEAASVVADTVVGSAASALFCAADSPAERRHLATSSFRLRDIDGGLSLSNHHHTRHASHAASFIATATTLRRVYPPLASVSLTSPDITSFAAASDALTTIRTALDDVRTGYAALDDATYYDVRGRELTDFHPHLPSKLTNPQPPASTSCSTTHQRARLLCHLRRDSQR